MSAQLTPSDEKSFPDKAWMLAHMAQVDAALMQLYGYA